MEIAAESSPDGDSAEPAETQLPEVIDIAKDGQVVLDVTFETSERTLKAARRPSSHTPSYTKSKTGGWQATPPPQPKPVIRRAYRVDVKTLTSQSRYFAALLTNTRFAEAKDINSKLATLHLTDDEPPASASLPWVKITDDDQATRSASRHAALEGLLRILHGQECAATSMNFLTNLAIFADRFVCLAPVARYCFGKVKFKWPATALATQGASTDGMGNGSLGSITGNRGATLRKPSLFLPKDDGVANGVGSGGYRMSLATEDLLRQKILVFWLLEQPLKFQAAARELIMYGSRQWCGIQSRDEEVASQSVSSQVPSQDTIWWHLPDDLEEELRFRRYRILLAIASVQRHFLGLYAARRPEQRLCVLGYDSSVSCDSFQLGEFVRFLTNKKLLSFRDLLPSSAPASAAGLSSAHYAIFENSGTVYDEVVDIELILSILKKCPGYQIDKNHTNCGPRTKILPIVDFILGRLSATVNGFSIATWKKDRAQTSWLNILQAAEQAKRPTAISNGIGNGHVNGNGEPLRGFKRSLMKSKPTFVVGEAPGHNNSGYSAGLRAQQDGSGIFRFTREVANEQRLRHVDMMGGSTLAQDFFLADAWDWTPSD